MNRKRRQFLADVGQGMLIASLGGTVAADLGLATAFGDEKPDASTPKQLEPLAALMGETPLAKLQPLLVEKLKTGTELRTLVAACAVANARRCSMADPEGPDIHAFMALAPAWEMSRELPVERRALPVLKVLYWNAAEIQASKSPILQPVQPAALPERSQKGELLREAVRNNDLAQAESILAALTQGSTAEAFAEMQPMLQGGSYVHRVVLAWRAWATLDLTGPEYAHTLLRQSVRWCVYEDGKSRRGPSEDAAKRDGLGALVAKLLDQHKLLARSLGQRQAEDAWVEKLSLTIYGSTSEQAADTVAAALAEGMAPDAIGEAIALAANRLLLCDPGHERGKRKGGVHGNSNGVHGSDAANGWCNIARVSNLRNKIASLIIGAHGAAAGQWPKNLFQVPYPWPEHLAKVRSKDAAGLLHELESAIKNKDQGHACACVQRYSELGQPARPVFDLMLKYAVSEDGDHHAEKYYRTVSEEFAVLRHAFRWRELVALARVTASAYGEPTPGYAEACRLLNV